MSDEHPREIDPVTGYDTTGHEWNGIRELNTPFPRIVIWALVLTVVYSVISWVLLPAWPLGRDYTRGLLGLDQGEMAIAGLENLSATRQDWMAEFAGGDFAALQSDPALLDRAMPSAARLFSDNCAGCHGAEGAGGPGFPVLRDDHWLWGGEPETIAETIRVGINADHPDTRLAEMPPFSWMSYDERHALAAYVAALHEGTADPDSDAATLFYDNCAACHGDTGEGGLMIGVPSLRDAAVLYGQSPEIVAQTLLHGRRGVMPSWSGRLSEAEINLLATYVASLGTSPGAAQ